MNEKDNFYLEEVYPLASDVFSSEYKPLDVIKDKAIFVLDTNALLVPYYTSEKGVDIIKGILTELKKNNRLIIPARVAREFANNRPKKISDVFLRIRQYNQKLNSGDFKVDNFPLLESNSEFKKILDESEKIREAVKELKKKLIILEDTILSWNWNDPVSLEYRNIFTTDIIVEVKKENDKLVKDLERRIKHKIAPGYQDSAKSDGGIGDLIIWQTIIEIGKEKNNDIIFVTNDSKNDWFIRQDNQKLFPKFELYDEFRRETNGANFSIIDYVKFLNLFDAPTDMISEVKNTLEIDAQKSNLLSSDELIKSYQEQLTQQDQNIYIKNLKVEIGMMVEHEKFGEGKVISINTNRTDTSADIYFKNYGLKTLILEWASLRPI